LALLDELEKYGLKKTKEKAVPEITHERLDTKEIIKSFDTYEEADAYCNSLIAEGKMKG
jgi:hypothetical protein